jgi:hypothetical protein
MALERGQTPHDEELRRRAARLAECEERLARRERDVAAREAELEVGDIDRRLRRVIVGGLPGTRRAGAIAAARHIAPVAPALWLMALPLLFSGERGALLAAAVIAGAALAFLTLVRQRLRIAAPVPWGLGAVGTWLLAWGGLGHATSGAGWALAVTGALAWVMALTPPRE